MTTRKIFLFFAGLANQAYHLHLFLTRPVTLGVRVILVDEGEILLVKHTYHPGWLLPGGGVKRGETLEQAAVREVREETGLIFSTVRLHGMYTNFHEYKSDHIAVFVGTGFDPSHLRRDPWEIEDARFFPIGDLPEDIRPGHRRRIEELERGDQPGFSLW